MDAGMYRMNLLCQDIQITGSAFNSIDVKDAQERVDSETGIC